MFDSVWREKYACGGTTRSAGLILVSVALVLLWFGVTFAAAGALESRPLTVDVQGGWKAGPAAPAPSSLGGARAGVGFESTAVSGVKRFYWEKRVDLNLAGKEVFEIEAFINGAENISQISLHFRSGQGWYSASETISAPTPRILQFDLADFEAEGGPNGWDQIDAIRISIWRSQESGRASMHLYRLIASNPLVLLVKDGSRQQKDPLSEKCAREVEQWLVDIDVAARTVYADELDRKLLSGRSLLVLPYNPGLKAGEVALVNAFLAHGGRLFAFYSDNPVLARAMGLRLDGHRRSEDHFPWTSIEFDPQAGGAFPTVLYQRATAVNPAYPAGKDARVLARWRSRRPAAAAPPAILESSRGFWMTQIPRKFDAVAKRQMLAAAVSKMVPQLAPRIARRMIELAGQVDSFRDVAHASLSMRKIAERSGKDPTTFRHIAQADSAYRAAQSAMLKGEYQGALAQALRIRASLELAYAALHRPGRNNGLRGVWDHHGVGLYPGDWEKTCRLLSAAGIDAVFPNMLNDGYAHYDTAVLNRSKTYADFGDQIAQCLAAAQKYDMQVHVWKVCWKLDGTPKKFVEKLRRAGRLQVDRDGKVLPWLNPAHPANRRLALASILELVENYEIDGVHLDYIRYGWNADDCSDYTRRAFEDRLGKTTDWPADILAGGKYRPQYSAWKVAQISSFVAEAYRRVKALDPELQLSAAVFGGYPDCVRTVAQDWRAWLADGIVDFVAPMNYTDSIDFFTELLERQARMPNAGRKIFPGIGVTSSQSALAPSDVIEQSNLISSKGFQGQLFFDLDAEFEGRVMPFLTE